MSTDSSRSSSRPRVLLVRLNLAPFVAKDLEILRSRLAVREADCSTLIGVLRSVAAAVRSDLVVCWFGSLRFLPAVLAARVARRPVAVVTGGYDVARVPEIGYGNMARPVTRTLGRLLFRLASVVLPFSESGAQEARVNALVPPSRIQVIPLGYGPDEAPPAGAALAKRPLVLTVGNADASTLLRKGLLTFVQVARAVPEASFVLAGRSTPDALARLQQHAAPNLRIAGFVADAELRRLFAEAAVYLQPSVHEGFGSAVAEAMLYDCVPVIAPLPALRQVVGDCGIYADPRDIGQVARAVRAALAGPGQLPEAPRERIRREFPLDARSEKLLATLSGMLHR